MLFSRAPLVIYLGLSYLVLYWIKEREACCDLFASGIAFLFLQMLPIHACATRLFLYIITTVLMRRYIFLSPDID